MNPPAAPSRLRDRCGLLKNAWYAAALSQELIAKRPLGRVILEQPLVLWRADASRAVAMEDRCAHRNAALSKGAVFGGRLGCAYHGWVYDGDGQRVSVPSEGKITSSLPCGVATFPVREQDGLVWVWMGDGSPTCDPFPMPYWDSPGWGRCWGSSTSCSATSCAWESRSAASPRG